MTNLVSVSTLVVILFSGILSSSEAAGGVDELLGNREFIQNQVSCVLDKGPCDGIGAILKNVALKEVIANDCRTCTPAERTLANKVVSFMQKNYASDWNTVVAKFRQYSTRRHN